MEVDAEARIKNERGPAENSAQSSQANSDQDSVQSPLSSFCPEPKQRKKTAYIKMGNQFQPSKMSIDSQELSSQNSQRPHHLLAHTLSSRGTSHIVVVGDNPSGVTSGGVQSSHSGHNREMIQSDNRQEMTLQGGRAADQSPIAQCLNDDMIDIQENDEIDHIMSPAMIQEITDGSSKEEGSQLRKKRKNQDATVLPNNQVAPFFKRKLPSDATVTESDNRTLYENQEPFSPGIITQNAEPSIRGVKIASSRGRSRERTTSDESYDSNTGSVSLTLKITATDGKRDSMTSYQSQNGMLDTTGGDKPLPLRRINREKLYKKASKLAHQDHNQNYHIHQATTIGRNEVSGQNCSFMRAQRESKSLMIDARQQGLGRKGGNFRSPFRYNRHQQQVVAQSPKQRSNERTNHQRISNPGGQQAGLVQSKYSFSPTTTNLLSQRNGKPSAQTALFATSFNGLPSVARSSKNQEHIKALFNLNQNSMQTIKATGSSSYFPHESFINKEQVQDQSMVGLLQQVAEFQARKANANAIAATKNIVLNEQSTVDLPMDPELQKEIEAIQNMSKSHIKIMVDNQMFLMQPGLHQQDQTSPNHRGQKRGEYKVQITSQKKDTSRENSSIESFDSGDETSKGIKNLLQMQELADKLSQVFQKNSAIPSQTQSNNVIARQQIDQQNIYRNNSLLTRRQSEDPNFRKTGQSLNPFKSLYRKDQRLSLAPPQNVSEFSQLASPQNLRRHHDTKLTPRHERIHTMQGQTTERHQLPNLHSLETNRIDIQQQSSFQTQNKTTRSSNLPHQNTIHSKLYQDVSFGMIGRENMPKAGVTPQYLSNYTEKEKVKIMQIAQKATALRHKKTKPKLGLGLAFKEAKKRQSIAKQSTSKTKSMHTVIDSSMKRSFELGDEGTLPQTPLAFQVIAPSIYTPRAPVPQSGRDSANMNTTLYKAHEGTIMSSAAPPTPNSPCSQSIRTPMSNNRLGKAPSLHELRPKYDPDDEDQRSVHVQDGGQHFQSFSVNPHMLKSHMPVRQHTLLSQGSRGSVSGVDNLSMLTKLNKSQEKEHSPKQLIKDKRPSYAHQNSNQNLYSKEVYLKFPHKSTQRRILMKVQGNSPRVQQEPSIPRRGKSLANESVNQETNHQKQTIQTQQHQMLPELTTQSKTVTHRQQQQQLSSLFQQPQLTTGQAQQQRGSNPFAIKNNNQLLGQQQQNNVQMISQEFDMTADQSEQTSLVQQQLEMEQRKRLIMQMQENILKQKQSVELVTHHPSLQTPKVTLMTSRLSNKKASEDNKNGGQENNPTSQPIRDNAIPKTKREFLDQYKQAIASSIKLQKKQNKEKIELQKSNQKQRQPQCLNEPPSQQQLDMKSMTSPAAAYYGTNFAQRTLETEGDDTMPLHQNQQYFFDSDQFTSRGNEQLKSAVHQQRVKGFPGNIPIGRQIDVSAFNTAAGLGQDVQNNATMMKNNNAALKTFQGPNFAKNFKQPSHIDGNLMPESLLDSTETYEDMGQTVKMTQEMMIEASQILRSAQMEYESIVSSDKASDLVINQDGLIGQQAAYPLTKTSDDNQKRNQLRPVNRQRPSFFAIEKMEQQELIKRKANLPKKRLEKSPAQTSTNLSPPRPNNDTLPSLLQKSDSKPLPSNANTTNSSNYATAAKLLRQNSTQQQNQHQSSSRRTNRDNLRQTSIQGAMQYKASYMPSNLDKKTASLSKGPPSFIMEQHNNDDIINLLQPETNNNHQSMQQS